MAGVQFQWEPTYLNSHQYINSLMAIRIGCKNIIEPRKFTTKEEGQNQSQVLYFKVMQVVL